MTTTNPIRPTPAHALDAFPELPGSIQSAIEALSRPWPYDQIQIRPGPINREGTAAQALPYHDWWCGYLPRLNDIVGPNNFRIRLLPWGDDVIAHLRAFGGIIEGWSSGSAKQDKLGPMEAEAQAKKRVCAEKLMLGLYLYYLPVVWMRGEYDRERKLFYPNDGEEQRCAYELYARAGLLPRTSPGATFSQAQRPPQPTAEAQSTAVAALRAAEQRTGVAPAPLGATAHGAPHASEAQLGLIVGLLHGLTSTAQTDLDAVGQRFGIAELSALRTKDRLRAQAATLTRLNASKLIDALKALESPPARAA